MGGLAPAVAGKAARDPRPPPGAGGHRRPVRAAGAAAPVVGGRAHARAQERGRAQVPRHLGRRRGGEPAPAGERARLLLAQGRRGPHRRRPLVVASAQGAVRARRGPGGDRSRVRRDLRAAGEVPAHRAGARAARGGRRRAPAAAGEGAPPGGWAPRSRAQAAAARRPAPGRRRDEPHRRGGPGLPPRPPRTLPVAPGAGRALPGAGRRRGGDGGVGRPRPVPRRRRRRRGDPRRRLAGGSRRVQRRAAGARDRRAARCPSCPRSATRWT